MLIMHGFFFKFIVRFFFFSWWFHLVLSVCVRCSIFGNEGQDAEDVIYVNWLSMVRAGLLGLEFYTPESKSWRQVECLLKTVVLKVRGPAPPRRNYSGWFSANLSTLFSDCCIRYCCVLFYTLKRQTQTFYTFNGHKLLQLILFEWNDRNELF